MYTGLVFAIIIWVLQKIHLWVMHNNIVWTDLLIGLMTQNHVPLTQYIVR